MSKSHDPSMAIESLNPTIAEYIASSREDTDKLVAFFTPDASVTDENKLYKGSDEIRRWFEKTSGEFEFTSTTVSFLEDGAETVVKCNLIGNFPGSPIDLYYHFQLSGGKIAKLKILDE
jgi:hypothetical protein